MSHPSVSHPAGTDRKSRVLAIAVIVLAIALPSLFITMTDSSESSTFVCDDITYEICDNGKEACIIDGSDAKGNVVLPDTVENDGTSYNVVSVASKAFMKNNNISSIAFGTYLKEIGDYAFYDCTGLKEITFPLSLKKIGHMAFFGDYSVEKTTFLGGEVEMDSDALQFGTLDNAAKTLILSYNLWADKYLSDTPDTDYVFPEIEYDSSTRTLTFTGSGTLLKEEVDDALTVCPGAIVIVIGDDYDAIGSAALAYHGICDLVIGSGIKHIEEGALDGNSFDDITVYCTLDCDIKDVFDVSFNDGENDLVNMSELVGEHFESKKLLFSSQNGKTLYKAVDEIETETVEEDGPDYLMIAGAIVAMIIIAVLAVYRITY